MDDILNVEVAQEEKHSEECFCQLCRPSLVNDPEEVAIASYEPVAA
jgi:hypothetical protein